MFLIQREKALASGIEFAKKYYARWRYPDRKPWPIHAGKLASYSAHTLGGHLRAFLRKHQLQLVPFYETHDVQHVLAGYGATVKEEVCLQYFLLGSGYQTPMVCVSVLAGFLLLPEYVMAYRKAWLKGRRCICFGGWNFEHMLHEPMTVLQELIHKRRISKPTFLI